MSTGGFGSTDEAYAAVSRDLAASLDRRYGGYGTSPHVFGVDLWKVQVLARMSTERSASGMSKEAPYLSTGVMKMGELGAPRFSSQEVMGPGIKEKPNRTRSK